MRTAFKRRHNNNKNTHIQNISDTNSINEICLKKNFTIVNNFNFSSFFFNNTHLKYGGYFQMNE